MMEVLAVAASTLQFWSTVATVAAVVVALALGVVPPIVKWWRRPVLEVEVGDSEPFVRPATLLSGGRGPHVIMLRVRVGNVGRNEARRVRTQVTHWWSKADDPNYEWVTCDIDPMSYPWVSAPPAEDDARAPFFTDLSGGGSDYVEVARYEPGPCRLTLVAPDRRERPFRLEATHSLVEQRIELTVGAENASLIRQVIAFDVSHEKWITNVRLSEPPPPEKTLPGGLLGILRAREEIVGEAEDNLAGM